VRSDELAVVGELLVGVHHCEVGSGDRTGFKFHPAARSAGYSKRLEHHVAGRPDGCGQRLDRNGNSANRLTKKAVEPHS